MDTQGLKWCYFLCLSATPTAGWCYFFAYQNDVTFYAYQLLPLRNDVNIDAYQPKDIAIYAYQVWNKIEIGLSQNDLLIRVWSVRLEFLLPPKTNYPPFRFISLKYNPPPAHHLPTLHFGLFGGRQKISKKTSHQQKLNPLTRINVDIEHRDDGNVLVA